MPRAQTRAATRPSVFDDLPLWLATLTLMVAALLAGAAAAQAYMNQAIAVQALPLTLLSRCGIDFDRWYPFPRRVVGLLKMKAHAQRDIPRCSKTLDRVADRFGVHCRPLA